MFEGLNSCLPSPNISLRQSQGPVAFQTFPFDRLFNGKLEGKAGTPDGIVAVTAYRI
ncbi:MAG: hypothetical protein M0Q53_07570 [Prolixibacteraceae bacterium]|nr:hypothetical protein [Prolixibacteraceae bacterium]